MDNRLFRYSEFLNESKLELLLEANIKYSILFSKLLDQIDSPVAKALSSLSDNEVDANTNYIDINREKDDVVYFKPDDKVSKAAMVDGAWKHFEGISKQILGKDYRIPLESQTGEIEKEFTREELELESVDGLNYVYPHDKLVTFMWRDSKGIGRCIFAKKDLVLGESAVKRSEVGVGKLARALLKSAHANPSLDIPEFSTGEIEDFVYKYRAEVAKLGDVFSRFRILEGEDIRKYYNEDRYESVKGTLGTSCMRHDRCQPYLDIYVKNPEQCNLVVLMSDEKEDLICGRALLWTDVDGKRIMDRIYSNRTQDEQLFKDFAKKNNFYYKKNQNMLEDEYFVSPEGEEEELMTKIELSVNRYNYFPYLDTFKYFCDGRPSYVTNNSGLSYDYTLTDTEGSAEGLECEMCNGNGIVDCPECYGRGDFGCQNCDEEGEVECGTCEGNHEIECLECDGKGTSEDGSECTDCEGRGMQTCPECDGESVKCPECDGDGRLECDWCRGEGEVDCPGCN
jgi:hypothetical protein